MDRAGEWMRDGAEVQHNLTIEPRPWWESRLCMVLIVLLSMVPLLYPPIPPLVDMFGHLGRYRVELAGADSPLHQYYSYHWAAIGNLGVDVLVLPLAPLLGLELAVKVIVVLIPALTAIGFLWVAREVHGRIPPTIFFALPFVYSFPFLFGFVNFALSVALAFLAFGLWLRLGRQERTTLRGWLFVPISIVVFFAHTYGWGMLGLLCFSADAVRLHDRGRTWFKAGFEAALHTSVMAFPILIMLAWRSEAPSGMTTDWFEWRVKWRWMFSALRDRWGAYDIFSVAFAAVIFLFALVSPKLTLSRNLAFSAIVLACSFALLPRIVFGSAYADMRLVPYMMATALIAIRFKEPSARGLAQMLAIIGIVFALVRLAGTTASMTIAANDQKAKLAALDHIPRGARVASFNGLPCVVVMWSLPRNGHLGGLVLARREGFSNDQWLTEGLNLLRLKYRGVGSYGYDPSEIVRPNRCHDGLHRTVDDALANIPRDKFDYVWVIDVPPYDPKLVADWTPVWRGPGSILYQLH